MEKPPEDLLDRVENYFDKPLIKKQDLQIIFEVCYADNMLNEFERLSFTGKYVNGLLRVLKSSTSIPEVENTDNLKKDLSENMENIISQLTEIISNADKKNKISIEENYLKLSQISLQNLQSLAEDLDKIKIYLNHIKRDDLNKTS